VKRVLLASLLMLGCSETASVQTAPLDQSQEQVAPEHLDPLLEHNVGAVDRAGAGVRDVNARAAADTRTGASHRRMVTEPPTTSWLAKQDEQTATTTSWLSRREEESASTAPWMRFPLEEMPSTTSWLSHPVPESEKTTSWMAQRGEVEPTTRSWNAISRLSGTTTSRWVADSAFRRGSCALG